MGRRGSYSTDGNHGRIVKALRAAGCTVINTAMVGEGFPDLVVGFRMTTILVEVKDEGGELEDTQRAFLRTWRGGPVVVVRTVEEALRKVGVPVSSSSTRTVPHYPGTTAKGKKLATFSAEWNGGATGPPVDHVVSVDEARQLPAVRLTACQHGIPGHCSRCGEGR